MTMEDLYKEEECVRCGQKVLKSASFCPHCGYIKERGGLIERIKDLFGGGGGSAEAAGKKGGFPISTVIGLVFAGYLVYTAIRQESVQSLIMAVLVLFALLQTWLASRKKAQGGDRTEGEGEERSESSDEIIANKFFCENCSAEVDAEATSCPKCGMKFGEGEQR